MNTQSSSQFPRRAPAPQQPHKPLTAYNPERALQRARFYLDVLEAHFNAHFEEWERVLSANREKHDTQ